MSKTAAFCLLVSITVSFLAGSAAPTPLYAVYHGHRGVRNLCARRADDAALRRSALRPRRAATGPLVCRVRRRESRLPRWRGAARATWRRTRGTRGSHVAHCVHDALLDIHARSRRGAHGRRPDATTSVAIADESSISEVASPALACRLGCTSPGRRRGTPARDRSALGRRCSRCSGSSSGIAKRCRTEVNVRKRRSAVLRSPAYP